MNDPHLREIRDCVQQKDWPRLKEFDSTFHKLRDSLSNTNGVLCLDEKIVVPKKLRIKFVNLLHAAHPGQLGMTAAAEYMWWPGKNKQLIAKCKSCMSCQGIDKLQLGAGNLLLPEPDNDQPGTSTDQP